MTDSTRKIAFHVANEGEIVNAPEKRLGALTERRQQVTTFVCRGLSNRQIAEKLGVTEGTVKAHLRSIFEQLGVQSRIELMIALTDHTRQNVS